MAGRSVDASLVIGEYRRLNEIGKGSFAMVYRGVHVQKGALVAIKSVNLSKLSRKLKENLQSEVKILRELHHPHIVSLFDCRESKTTAHLVMEFCELGDLSTFIRKRSTLADHDYTRGMIQKYPNQLVGGLHEVIVRHFLKQIASGLHWIRSRDFLHRDIKPQNLLLVPSVIWQAKHKHNRPPLMIDEEIKEPAAGIDSLPMLKIADFGFARFLPSLQLAETLCGSPLYMAPEILRYEKYDAKADLWSTGTVAYEMMVGRPPFRAQNHVELIAKIDKNEDRIKFPEGLVITSGMKNLIRALLKRKSVERISYDRFFQHPVITEEIPGLVPEDSRAASVASSQPGTEPAQAPASPPPASPRVPSSSAHHQPASLTIPSEAPRLCSLARANSSSRQVTGTNGRTHIADAVSRLFDRRTSFSGTPHPQLSTQRPQQGRHLSSPVTSPRSYDRKASDDGTLRQIQERAEQDIAFERDVVFVEKKAVEVNSLADAFDNSPEVRAHQNAVVRRTMTTIGPYSTTAPQTSTRGWSIPDQVSTHSRQRSLDKHLLARSPSSATSAISKAIHMASFRVCGLGSSPPAQLNNHGATYSPFPPYATPSTNPLLTANSAKGVDLRDEDMRIALHAERLAHRSSVIFDFAEVKYQQLAPVRPIDVPGTTMMGDQNSAIDEHEADDLTMDAVITVAEEALVLYVHALSILAKVFDVTAEWFYQKQRLNPELSARSAPVRSASVVPRINSVVQWVRMRFNECLEKSEFAGRRLLDAQKKLPVDHPSHPSNHKTPSASSSSIATTSVGGSAENIVLTSGVTAGKLMYERAVEMSRAAAINELTNEDLEGAERSYRTASHMLEAVLDDDEQNGMGQRIGRNTNNAAAIGGLEQDDRAAVEKLLEHLRTRLHSLRQKLEHQKVSRRLSRGANQGTGPVRDAPGKPCNSPLSSSPKQ